MHAAVTGVLLLPKTSVGDGESHYMGLPVVDGGM